MTNREFAELQVGDLIKNRSGDVTLVVTSHYGDRVIAVETWSVSNPPEWNIVSKAKHDNPGKHCGSFEAPYTMTEDDISEPE